MRTADNGYVNPVAGRFVERVDEILTKGIAFEGIKLVIETVELGDDPFIETVNTRFRVSELSRSPEEASRPSFFFTFTSELSIDDNVRDLKEFVIEQTKLAGIPPLLEDPAPPINIVAVSG